MRGQLEAGFRERRHTADWALDLWASNLPDLFQAGAQGMYSLLEVETRPGAGQERLLNLAAEDVESLLVSFLNELLYDLEQSRVAYRTGELAILPGRLEAHLTGLPVISQNKEIKAVTFHRLAIHREAGNYRATLVFDV